MPSAVSSHCNNTSTSIAKAGVFLLIVLFLQWRPQGIAVQQRRGLT